MSDSNSNSFLWFLAGLGVGAGTFAGLGSGSIGGRASPLNP